MALATSSGTDLQHANYNSSTPSHSNTHHLSWTPAHEARLTHVQAQLAAAQARWSEEQDLWLDEVQGLEELKRAHKKAAKKEAKRLAKKSATIWKTKAIIAPTSAGASEEEEDDDDHEAKAKNGSQEIPRSSPRVALRRVNTTPTGRSTFAEGEPSNELRRGSMIERVQSVGFGGLLRRWSSRGEKGAGSSHDS